MNPEPELDFEALVAQLHRRGVRFLVFGRQAMRALGSPVLTQDYDLWIDPASRDEVMRLLGDDLGFELLHAPMERPPVVKAVAGPESLDAWFVRGMVNRQQVRLSFEEVYARSLIVGEPQGLWFRVPSVPDMIALKRMGATVRPKDEEDIRYLEVRSALIAQGRLKPDSEP